MDSTVTEMLVEDCTTWLLVRMYPFDEMIMPVPAACSARSYCSTVLIVTTPTSCAAVDGVAAESPAAACCPIDWPSWKPRLPSPGAPLPLPREPKGFCRRMPPEELVLAGFAPSSMTTAVPRPATARTTTLARETAISTRWLRRGVASGTSAAPTVKGDSGGRSRPLSSMLMTCSLLAMVRQLNAAPLCTVYEPARTMPCAPSGFAQRDGGRVGADQNDCGCVNTPSGSYFARTLPSRFALAAKYDASGSVRVASE